MPKIAIMTDSNCGITPDDAQKYHIHILPMPVLVGEDTFYEGCNITSEEFYRKLSSGEPVTTSQPSPADVMKMWDQLLKEHDEVVHVPMSSGLSNSCQTALLLAQEEYFKGRVHVVDNHRISVTQAQSVLDAVELTRQRFTGAQIKEILETEAMDATIYIAVDTLEYLKKGGRITAAAAAIGTVLNLKPVLTIQGDKLDAYTKTRGMKSAFKAMCKALDKDLSGRLSALHTQGLLKAGILHTVISHHSSETIGNLRLQILEKRIFTIGTDSHHQLIISNIFQQQIEIFGSSLKVSIHIPYIYRLCIVDTCFHSST